MPSGSETALSEPEALLSRRLGRRPKGGIPLFGKEGKGRFYNQFTSISILLIFDYWCLEIGCDVLSRIQFAAFGHIEEDAIPGLIDTEGFSLLIDMLDHQFGRFYWIGLESPFPF